MVRGYHLAFLAGILLFSSCAPKFLPPSVEPGDEHVLLGDLRLLVDGERAVTLRADGAVFTVSEYKKVAWFLADGRLLDFEGNLLIMFEPGGEVIDSTGEVYGVIDDDGSFTKAGKTIMFEDNGILMFPDGTPTDLHIEVGLEKITQDVYEGNGIPMLPDGTPNAHHIEADEEKITITQDVKRTAMMLVVAMMNLVEHSTGAVNYLW